MPLQLSSTPLLSGFSLGASLIIAIGSQNASVFGQGLKREYVFAVSTVGELGALPGFSFPRFPPASPLPAAFDCRIQVYGDFAREEGRVLFATIK